MPCGKHVWSSFLQVPSALGESTWRAFLLNLTSPVIQLLFTSHFSSEFWSIYYLHALVVFVGCRHQGAQWPLLAGKLPLLYK